MHIGIRRIGYPNQMHMIHDFRQLSGTSPTGILEQISPLVKPEIDLAENEIPERLLL